MSGHRTGFSVLRQIPEHLSPRLPERTEEDVLHSNKSCGLFTVFVFSFLSGIFH